MILKPLKWSLLCLVHGVYAAAVSVTLGLLVVLWALRSWAKDLGQP